MERNDPNPATAKDKAEGSRENVNAGANPQDDREDFDRDNFAVETGLDGKPDSGPEPDVFPRNIPPPD